MSSDRSLQLRAQEIMQANPGEIAAADALKLALNERFEGDTAAAYDFACQVISKSMKALRTAAYELDDSQGILFSLPTTIVVDTDRGPLYVGLEKATLGQVKQYAKAGKQYHAGQDLKFGRLIERLEHLKDAPADLPWTDARSMLPAEADEAVPGEE
ncbi:hypothetical protein [Roseateles sp.]|uniref:hypothetical protein n=1 Tax=Roseateles sp. TaxID=1971397 RepID=UPI002F3F2783